MQTDCWQVGDFIDNPNNQKTYKIDQILSNNNGRVYKCSEQVIIDQQYETIRTVIVKELDDLLESSEKNFDILTKCENLHSLHLLLIHENFEKFIAGKRKVFIVMEFCGQDLQQVYKQLLKMNKLTMSFILQVLIQNVAGLAALQRVNLLHNDVKPTNMFVLNYIESSDGDGGQIEIVTGDYGNLLIGNVGNCDLEIEMDVMMGTNGYMAPEVENEDCSIYSIKSDIWSLGISLLVIISGKHATHFSSSNMKQQIDEIFEKLPNSESWLIIRKIIYSMLELDRKKRIDYSGILQLIFSQYPKTDPISDTVHSIEKDYRFLDPAFKTDRNLAMLAVEKYGNNLQHVNAKFQNDVEIVTKAVKQSGNALKYASKACRLNKEIVIQAISNNGMSIKHTCFSLKDNLEIAKIALRNNIYSQEFVTPRIKESEEWKSIVSERNSELMIETSNTNQKNGQITEDLIRSIVENPHLLSQQPLHKRNDFEFVKALVSINGNCLEHAYDSLRDNEEIVQIAFSNSASALQFASDRLRDNLKIVETASVLFPQSSMKYASRNIQENEEFILRAAKRNAKALYYCPKKVFHYLNSDFISKLLTCNGEALEFCHYVTKKDYSMVRLAVSQNGMAIRFAHHSLRDNFDIMLAAVTSNGGSLEYGTETIRSNPKIIMAALNQNLNEALPYVHETVLSNENGIIKKWVSQSSSRKLKVFFSKDKQMWQMKQTNDQGKQEETKYSMFITTLHELIEELAKINELIRLPFAGCQGNAAQLAVLLRSLENDVSIHEKSKSKIYHLLAIIFGGIHGDIMVDLFEYDITFKYLQKAAECGNIYCKLHLIYYYLYGTGTECNIEQAMKLLEELESDLSRKSNKKLSDRERDILASSQYMLSKLLLHSFDPDLFENEYQTNLRLKISQNIPRGIDLLRKSSNNGLFIASIFLGECYRDGRFKLEKDFITSNEYYDLAAKQGYTGQLSSSGVNIQKSYSGAEVEGLVMFWNLKEELYSNTDDLTESDIEKYADNEQNLARVFASLGKFDESISLFIKVAEKSSIHFMVHFKIGELYFKKSFMDLASNDLNTFLQNINQGIPYIFKALSATLIDELGCYSFDSRGIIQKTRKHILDRLDAIMKIIFSSKFKSLLGADNIETLETFLDILEKCAFEEEHYEAYYYLGVAVIRKYRYSSKCMTDFFYKASMLGKEFSMKKIDEIENYFSSFPIESLISRLLQANLF